VDFGIKNIIGIVIVIIILTIIITLNCYRKQMKTKVSVQPVDDSINSLEASWQRFVEIAFTSSVSSSITTVYSNSHINNRIISEIVNNHPYILAFSSSASSAPSLSRATVVPDVSSPTSLPTVESHVESPSSIDSSSQELRAEPGASTPQVPSSWPPEKYYNLWCRFIRIFGLVTNIGFVFTITMIIIIITIII